jgi:tRNA dimethylallyltransferase
MMLVILGPTAVGKTAVALEAAKLLKGEIVSCDSMQIYRGMDIGTAKPSPGELEEIPHHLIDIVGPEEKYDVARFLREAEAAVETIRSKGVRPIVVGGTPMYLKAFLFGIFDGPEADPAIRERLRSEAEETGTEKLWDRLREVDPQAADRIHPNDLRRIVRALEVYEKAGVPISSLQKEWERENPPREATLVGLSRPRDILYDRVDARVDAMFAAGLVEEVGKLRGRLGPTASRALGYREVLDHLDGKMTLEDAVLAVKNNTHNFVRKQMTWYRSLESVDWVEIGDREDPSETAQSVLSIVKRKER